jgi:hypothetical protein
MIDDKDSDKFLSKTIYFDELGSNIAIEKLGSSCITFSSDT